ncbi:hypothetical protein PoB_001635700 [Plakobranchus ocellatus]|uniref:Uncharacterized protein n=1 Tax=Plakobranchus ocellatus TaxID=259542 RepID=A0AAV3Z3M2_9GAST|nr:hypothetical protein PoB_001635700 [Plakobranchus ocellatus]
MSVPDKALDDDGDACISKCRTTTPVYNRLSGPPSGQGAGGGARTRDRRVHADLRADSLTTVLPTPQFMGPPTTSELFSPFSPLHAPLTLVTEYDKSHSVAPLHPTNSGGWKITSKLSDSGQGRLAQAMSPYWRG